MSRTEQPKVPAIAVDFDTHEFGEAEIGVPPMREGDVRINPLRVTLCGTDYGLATGRHGRPPEGSDKLVIGHEVAAEVDDPGSSNFKRGDLVAVRVRMPIEGLDPNSLVFRFPDMSHEEDKWTEFGISQQHGGLAGQRVISADQLVRLPDGIPLDILPLCEQLSCIEKLQRRMTASRYSNFPFLREENEDLYTLIIGSGSIGLMAALAFRYREEQSGGDKTFKIAMTDVAPENSQKAQLARLIGAQYHQISGLMEDAEKEALAISTLYGRGHTGGFDYIFEAAGDPVAQQIWQIACAGAGVMGLFGIPHGDRSFHDHGVCQRIRHIVLNNVTVIGSVNAGVDDWPVAADILRWGWENHREFLQGIVNRRIDGFDPRAVLDALQDPSVIRAVVSIPESARAVKG